MVQEHFDFVWRSLRRHGLDPSAADDAAQQVFLVATRRLGDIKPGVERSFLFQTALRVASDATRARARKREDLTAEGELEVTDGAPSPEDRADKSTALKLLDEVLASMPEDLRTPFVLFEIEALEVTDIAELLGIPTGTAASRLRRAREEFHAAGKRLRSRMQFQRRTP